jgi:hypothetical protein
LGGTQCGLVKGRAKCPRSRTKALAIAALLVVRWDSAPAAETGAAVLANWRRIEGYM